MQVEQNINFFKTGKGSNAATGEYVNLAVGTLMRSGKFVMMTKFITILGQ